MSKKHFSWLLVITLAAAALVFLIPQKTGKESERESGKLLPGLASVANDLDYLKLTAAGNETVATFQRKEGKWRLVEAESYPADWDRLKSLLSELSQAEVIEQKTSNPDYYARLGVEDVSAPEAAGVMLEFAEATGLPAVIIGNSATGREGQYVRLAGGEGSVLIDRSLDLPADRDQWLDREIVDISRDEVVEVNITHPDGETITAVRKSADDENFELMDVPADREPTSNWAVNALGGGMSSLRLEKVTEDSGIDWSSAIVFTLLTADGMRANCWLVDTEEGSWVRLGVSVYQAMGQQAEPQEGEEQEFTEVLTERVNQINERVSGWAYRIPQHQFDTMTKRMEDLLKPLEDS
jgi:hypothetical protein